MSQDRCTLTVADFRSLEILLGQLQDDDPARTLLQRKIKTSSIVPPNDLAPDVATLNSRVTYRVNDGAADTHILSLDSSMTPSGLFLSISTDRALALLGLREGQAFHFLTRGGTEESVKLERVVYQPEAATRETRTLPQVSTAETRRPALRVISGALSELKPRKPTPIYVPNGSDDPGPSAA